VSPWGNYRKFPGVSEEPVGERGRWLGSTPSERLRCGRKTAFKRFVRQGNVVIGGPHESRRETVLDAVCGPRGHSK